MPLALRHSLVKALPVALGAKPSHGGGGNHSGNVVITGISWGCNDLMGDLVEDQG